MLSGGVSRGSVATCCSVWLRDNMSLSSCTRTVQLCTVLENENTSARTQSTAQYTQADTKTNAFTRQKIACWKVSSLQSIACRYACPNQQIAPFAQIALLYRLYSSARTGGRHSSWHKRSSNPINQSITCQSVSQSNYSTRKRAVTEKDNALCADPIRHQFEFFGNKVHLLVSHKPSFSFLVGNLLFPTLLKMV